MLRVIKILICLGVALGTAETARLSDEDLENLDKLLEPERWQEKCAKAIEEAGIKNPGAIPGVLEAVKYIIKEMDKINDDYPGMGDVEAGEVTELRIALDALGIEENALVHLDDPEVLAASHFK